MLTNTETKLRSLRSKSPKLYWNFLNNLSPKIKKNKESPSIEEFYEHFCNINFDPNQEQFNGIIYQHANNLDINSPITESEKCACIHNLKNCKASSPSDTILNEYQKQLLN